jgi:hypothetical protein
MTTVVNRILRDDPSKGDMHNRQALSPKMLWETLQDYHMWPIYLIGLTWLIPTNPMTSYLTLQLKAIGFSTFETNLLTVLLYPSPSISSPQANLQPDPRICPLHYPTPLLDLALRKDQPTISHRSRVSNLGPPPSHCPRKDPQQHLSMGEVDALNPHGWSPICSRHPCSHHIPECRCGSNAYSCLRSL